MSLNWALPALRWALYADLGVVFGVPMAIIATRGSHMIDGWRGAFAAAGLIGIAVSLAGFCLTVASMAGVPLADLDRGLVLSLLTGSALGWALLVRCAALVVLAGLAMFGPARHPQPLVLVGAIAVATLAWSGHAAASEAAAGWLRLVGDAAHLLAGLTWFGALVLFAASLWGSSPDDDSLARRSVSALSAFAFAGTIIVVLLAITGTANLLFLLSPAEWPTLLRTTYGHLLLAKLVVFQGMLALAALNRFVLVPGLERALSREARLSAIRRLRLSVTLELFAALAVLGLVAWLGTLDPLGANA